MNLSNQFDDFDFADGFHRVVGAFVMLVQKNLLCEVIDTQRPHLVLQDKEGNTYNALPEEVEQIYSEYGYVMFRDTPHMLSRVPIRHNYHGMHSRAIEVAPVNAAMGARLSEYDREDRFSLIAELVANPRRTVQECLGGGVLNKELAVFNKKLYCAGVIVGSIVGGKLLTNDPAVARKILGG